MCLLPHHLLSLLFANNPKMFKQQPVPPRTTFSKQAGACTQLKCTALQLCSLLALLSQEEIWSEHKAGVGPAGCPDGKAKPVQGGEH